MKRRILVRAYLVSIGAFVGVSALGCGHTSCVEAPDVVVNESSGGSAVTTDEATETTEAPPAEVRLLEDAERRASPPGTAEIAMLAQGRNAFLGRLVMEAGAAVPEHQDATEEYVHVLEGSGVITIDGVAHDVRPGATIFMPANATVSYQNGEARMVAIQVFAGPGPAAKYDAWRPLE